MMVTAPLSLGIKMYKVCVISYLYFFCHFSLVHSEHVEFLFNMSTVAKSEKILTAELHLFKLRPQASLTFNRHHFCQVRCLFTDPKKRM